MKIRFVLLLLAAVSIALPQVSTVPVINAEAASVAALAALPLPTYIAFGAAYDQQAGFNGFAAAIVPVSNNSGIYEATVGDLYPKANIVSGQKIYTIQASIRQEVHKVIFQDKMNMVLAGVGAGFTFAGSTTASSTTSNSTSASTATGATAALTFTYVRQLSKSWAFLIPVRAVYLANLGWKPIVQCAFTWKPGQK